jgi:hypothetical protein
MNEKKVKECFASTMKDIGIPDSTYSLEGYKEGASCIIEQNNRWLVFDAERAEKYRVKEFENIIQACFEVISRFARTKEDYDYLRGKFEQNLTRTLKKSGRWFPRKSRDMKLQKGVKQNNVIFKC